MAGLAKLTEPDHIIKYPASSLRLAPHNVLHSLVLLLTFHCRLYLSGECVREKERYEAREREEVVRKQRERKAVNIKARHQTDR